MGGTVAALLCQSLLVACRDDAAAPGTIAPPTAADIAAYCAVLDGATERPSEDTMAMPGEVALPGVEGLIDRMLRYQGSGDDVTALTDFNEATCGVRFP